MYISPNIGILKGTTVLLTAYAVGSWIGAGYSTHVRGVALERTSRQLVETKKNVIEILESMNRINMRIENMKLARERWSEGKSNTVKLSDSTEGGQEKRVHTEEKADSYLNKEDSSDNLKTIEKSQKSNDWINKKIKYQEAGNWCIFCTLKCPRGLEVEFTIDSLKPNTKEPWDLPIMGSTAPDPSGTLFITDNDGVTIKERISRRNDTYKFMAALFRGKSVTVDEDYQVRIVLVDVDLKENDQIGNATWPGDRTEFITPGFKAKFSCLP